LRTARRGVEGPFEDLPVLPAGEHLVLQRGQVDHRRQVRENLRAAGSARRGWLRLGWFRLGWFRLGWFRLGWFRLGWFRLGWVRHAERPPAGVTQAGLRPRERLRWPG
jgi:hypothetical protein